MHRHISGSSSAPLWRARSVVTTTTTTAAVIFTNASLTFPLPLVCARRHQRSTTSRQRSSTWQEKTKKFEARQKEIQEEAARAAQRRARYASGVHPSRKGDTGLGSPRSNRSHEEASSSTSSPPSSAEPTPPSNSLWTLLRGGKSGWQSQPINPLMQLQTWSSKSLYDPDARAAQRVIDAVNGLRRRNARRKDPSTIQLTEEQKAEIVNRYAATRWYGPLYRPFQNISDRQVRWFLRVAHIFIVIALFVFLIVVTYFYYHEMDAVMKLSPEDQRDYAYMVEGMRYSDIYNTGMEVLRRDDPLEALPLEVRLHMTIEACRAKKWHLMDWDVELRKMHPKSAVEEWDWVHCAYWTTMEIGRATSLGGGLFSSRILEVREARQTNAESEEEKNRFVEMEPTALPAQTKRGFFS